MADIVLAEVSGQAWLVRGEQYIDDLLGNTLEPHVSIEIVTCESKSAVNALWQAEDGRDIAHMWMIHPEILNRTKGIVESLAVSFAPWSAALEPGALRVLQRAATLARQAPADPVTLIRVVAADGAPMAAQMAELRCALIEAELARLDVAVHRIARETVGDGEPDRIEIVVRPA